MLDVERARERFPALAASPDWALFDNAGGTPPARPVIERAADYMSRLAVQHGASYPLSREAAAAVVLGRRAVARLVNADPDEVVLGPSSTALVKLVARALAPLLAPGDEVVVTNLDHEANVGPWRELEAHGVVLREWRMRTDGAELRVEDLEPLLGERTRLVCFTQVSNVVGTIHDVAAVAERVRAAGALTCVDGVAFAPHRRVDVRALGVDLWFASLYKVFGPHQAVLFGRRELLRRLRGQDHFFVGEDEVPRKLEPGNPNHELAASLPGVLEHLSALDGGAPETEPSDDRLESVFALVAEHERRLVEPLLDLLDGAPRVRLVGEPSADPRRRVPTVAFAVDGLAPAELCAQLDERWLATRHGHFYAYRAVRDLGLSDAGGVVRASLVHTNTPAEVERLVSALRELV